MEFHLSDVVQFESLLEIQDLFALNKQKEQNVFLNDKLDYSRIVQDFHNQKHI